MDKWRGKAWIAPLAVAFMMTVMLITEVTGSNSIDVASTVLKSVVLVAALVALASTLQHARRRSRDRA